MANAGVGWTVEGGAAEGLMTRTTFCTGAGGLFWQTDNQTNFKLGDQGDQGRGRKRTLLTTSAASEELVGSEGASGGEVEEKDDAAGKRAAVGVDDSIRGSSFSRGGTNARKLVVCSWIVIIICVANA